MVFLYAHCTYFCLLFVTSDGGVGSRTSPPYTGWREQGETEEAALPGGRVAGVTHKGAEACLRRCMVGGSPPLPARVVRVYREAGTGLGHRALLDGLRSTLPSQGCVLVPVPAVGVGRGWVDIPRAGERVRPLHLPRASSQATQLSHPLSDLLQKMGFHLR